MKPSVGIGGESSATGGGTGGTHTRARSDGLCTLAQPLPTNVDRTNSLNRSPHAMIEAIRLDASGTSFSATSIGTAQTSNTIDSGVCSSATAADADVRSAKCSSLDRRSQCSNVDSVLSVDVLGAVNVPGSPACTADSGAHAGKGHLLPSGFLTKSLFTRQKSSESNSGTQSSSVAPWAKLFERKRSESRLAVSNTPCLILEERPPSLPPKSKDEAARHKQQYERMVAAAKKREARFEKERREAEQAGRRHEEQISSAAQQWLRNFVPKWPHCRKDKKCLELWWHGLPPNIRGRVWALAIGNDANITPELYEICHQRALARLESARTSANNDSATDSQSENVAVSTFTINGVTDREHTVEVVALDAARTFPQLGLFQPGGPLHDGLLSILGAYACYRPDVGYVQSMSFLAAVLLLNLDSREAFVALVNLLNRPMQAAFFGVRQPVMTYYFIAYDRYFACILPKLHAHLVPVPDPDALDVRPDVYLIEWLYTMYAKSLPLELACRVWDLYFRDGEEFLFQCALGILSLFESELLQMDFEQCVARLTQMAPPSGSDIESKLDPDALFAHINRIQSMQTTSFAELLADVSGKLSPAMKATDSQQNICGSVPMCRLTVEQHSGKSGVKQHSRRQSATSMRSGGSHSALAVAAAGGLVVSKSMSGFVDDLLSEPGGDRDG